VEGLVDVKRQQLITYITFFVLFYKFSEMIHLNMQMRHYLMVTYGAFRRNLQTQTKKVVKQRSE